MGHTDTAAGYGACYEERRIGVTRAMPSVDVKES